MGSAPVMQFLQVNTTVYTFIISLTVSHPPSLWWVMLRLLITRMHFYNTAHFRLHLLDCGVKEKNRKKIERKQLFIVLKLQFYGTNIWHTESHIIHPNGRTFLYCRDNAVVYRRKHSSCFPWPHKQTLWPPQTPNNTLQWKAIKFFLPHTFWMQIISYLYSFSLWMLWSAEKWLLRYLNNHKAV